MKLCFVSALVLSFRGVLGIFLVPFYFIVLFGVFLRSIFPPFLVWRTALRAFCPRLKWWPFTWGTGREIWIRFFCAVLINLCLFGNLFFFLQLYLRGLKRRVQGFILLFKDSIFSFVLLKFQLYFVQIRLDLGDRFVWLLMCSRFLLLQSGDLCWNLSQCDFKFPFFYGGTHAGLLVVGGGLFLAHCVIVRLFSHNQLQNSAKYCTTSWMSVVTFKQPFGFLSMFWRH